MTRITSREIVVHIVYALDFTQNLSELTDERTNPAFFEAMAGEDDIFAAPPKKAEKQYISSVANGVYEHLAELDSYIEKYASGWKFNRIPRVAVAIMRVCMYEVLYRPDIPTAASVNAAVELCKKYEEQDVVAFINGILGSFVRGEMV